MKTQTKPTRSVRWIKRMTLPLGLGRLSITVQTSKGLVTAEYDCGAHLDSEGKVIGYRLVKDDDTAYDVNTTGKDWLCDCKDATYRQRECKHVLGLRAALARLA